MWPADALTDALATLSPVALAAIVVVLGGVVWWLLRRHLDDQRARIAALEKRDERHTKFLQGMLSESQDDE